MKYIAFYNTKNENEEEIATIIICESVTYNELTGQTLFYDKEMILVAVMPSDVKIIRTNDND